MADPKPPPKRSTRIAAAVAVASAMAASAEGIRQWAYLDPPGILTVCYGSTTNVQRGRKYNMDECRARLDADMGAAVMTVDRCVPGLPDHVLAAFADAAYNIGPRIACDLKASTAARLLAAGRIREACDQLPRWNKSTIAGVAVPLPGLTKRRAAERDLCLSGVA